MSVWQRGLKGELPFGGLKTIKYRKKKKKNKKKQDHIPVTRSLRDE